MFRALYYRTRYGSYLHNENGIKKFAERSLGHLIRKVTKKSAFYREMNENLLVEKANLRLREDELHEQPMLKAGEFFSRRRSLLMSNFLLIAVVAASLFLNFLSLSAIAEPETGFTVFLTWAVSIVMAIVLTLGGILMTERLIDAVLPSRPGYDDAGNQRAALPVWAIGLIGIELGLYGLSQVRGEMFEQNLASNLVQVGYVTLAMMLPLIAGAFRWYTMSFVDQYKTTQALRQIESRLAQIDSILRQNEEYESNFYKVRSIASWDEVNEFKAYKDNYNEKKGIDENLNGHFAQSYDTFQAEANKRYESDIRDITAKSIRRLELVEKSEAKAGSKLGQASAHPEVKSSDGSKKLESDDVYLSPQPIR